MSEHVYIVWVGGVDDHFDTREAANAAAQEWRDKGYDDVIFDIAAFPEDRLAAVEFAGDRHQ